MNEAVLKLPRQGRGFEAKCQPAAEVAWFPWSRVAEVDLGYLPCGHAADGFYSWSAGLSQVGERKLTRAVEGQLRGWATSAEDR